MERAQAASKNVAPAIPEGGWAVAGSAQVKKEPAQRAGDTEQNPLPPSHPAHASPSQAMRNNATATAIAQAGYPQRPVAKPGFEAELKKRTLTNLYNARPAWLTLAHEALDKSVASAYGWPDYTPEMSDDDILRQLLALNLARSSPKI